MMRRLLALVLLVAVAGPARAETPSLAWQKWDPALFDRAASARTSTSCCTWRRCGAIGATSWRARPTAIPPSSSASLEKFIPVRVDQDADPALCYRYENWGWPATIMLDKDGNEIFKRRGYIPPELFAKLLVAVIEDPSALPSYAIGAAVDPDAAGLSDERRARHRGAAAQELRQAATAVSATSIASSMATRSNGRWSAAAPSQRNADTGRWRDVRPRARSPARADLIDPVWGGMFQYSEKLDWSGPHLREAAERAARCPARLCARLADRPRRRRSRPRRATSRRWLMDFMRAPSGAFYTSQDADAGPAMHGDVFYAKSDAAAPRRAAAADRPQLYARENGWAIASLAALYDVTGDAALLDGGGPAPSTGRWPTGARPTAASATRRAADDDTHLGDTLAIAEAALALYRSTAERRYLALAAELGEVIVRDHRDPAGGFMVRQPEPGAKGVLARPVKQIDENVATVAPAQPAGPRHRPACLQRRPPSTACAI